MKERVKEKNRIVWLILLLSIIFFILIINLNNVSASYNRTVKSMEFAVPNGNPVASGESDCIPGGNGDPYSCSVQVYDAYIFKPGGIKSDLVDKSSNAYCGHYKVKMKRLGVSQPWNLFFSIEPAQIFQGGVYVYVDDCLPDNEAKALTRDTQGGYPEGFVDSIWGELDHNKFMNIIDSEGINLEGKGICESGSLKTWQLCDLNSPNDNTGNDQCPGKVNNVGSSGSHNAACVGLWQTFSISKDKCADGVDNNGAQNLFDIVPYKTYYQGVDNLELVNADSTVESTALKKNLSVKFADVDDSNCKFNNNPAGNGWPQKYNWPSDYLTRPYSQYVVTKEDGINYTGEIPYCLDRDGDGFCGQEYKQIASAPHAEVADINLNKNYIISNQFPDSDDTDKYDFYPDNAYSSPNNPNITSDTDPLRFKYVSYTKNDDGTINNIKQLKATNYWLGPSAPGSNNAPDLGAFNVHPFFPDPGIKLACTLGRYDFNSNKDGLDGTDIGSLINAGTPFDFNPYTGIEKITNDKVFGDYNKDMACFVEPPYKDFAIEAAFTTVITAATIPIGGGLFSAGEAFLARTISPGVARMTVSLVGGTIGAGTGGYQLYRCVKEIPERDWLFYTCIGTNVASIGFSAIPAVIGTSQGYKMVIDSKTKRILVKPKENNNQPTTVIVQKTAGEPNNVKPEEESLFDILTKGQSKESVKFDVPIKQILLRVDMKVPQVYMSPKGVIKWGTAEGYSQAEVDAFAKFALSARPLSNEEIIANFKLIASGVVEDIGTEKALVVISERFDSVLPIPASEDTRAYAAKMMLMNMPKDKLSNIYVAFQYRQENAKFDLEVINKAFNLGIKKIIFVDNTFSYSSKHDFGNDLLSFKLTAYSAGVTDLKFSYATPYAYRGVYDSTVQTLPNIKLIMGTILENPVNSGALNAGDSVVMNSARGFFRGISADGETSFPGVAFTDQSPIYFGRPDIDHFPRPFINNKLFDNLDSNALPWERTDTTYHYQMFNYYEKGKGDLIPATVFVK